jgi:dihydroorotase
MSSVFRKAPLLTLDTPKGWLIVQRGKNPRAWARSPDESQVTYAEGAAALQLEKSRAAAFKEEIPESWIVIPTGFDLQVHLRFPGQATKETLLGGLESALYGGFDGILTMPNTNPFLDREDVLAEAIQEAKRLSSDYPVQILFTAAATQGMQGQVATDIDSLARAGAAAITDDGWGVKSDQAQADVFQGCARNHLLFQQHAEMPGHKGVATASEFQRREKLPEYPRQAESEMIRRDLALLRKEPGARYHVLHVSTRESLEEIRRAKAEGLAVSAEVSPHHLIFSNADIPASSDPRCSYFKMNPPLFAPEDRAALREALRDGTIDCVSTDHAPHETENKAKGWLHAPFGTRGMETALPALLSLCAAGELSHARLVEVFSTNPRRLIAPHAKAPSGLLFVDPKAPWTVTETELPGISQNSCFLGHTLHGKWRLRCEQSRIFRS